MDNMRLRFRWRLRTALAVTAVLALAMAVGAEHHRRRVGQERAIAAIEKVGGMIGMRPFVCVVDPSRRPVEAIELTQPNVIDTDLADLAWLPELKCLNLSDTGITDAGLAHLAGLIHLEELWLIDT